MKERLKSIKKSLDAENYSFLDTDFYSQLPKMLEILGSKDAELRDNIAWKTFSKLFRSKAFLNENRKNIVELLSSEKFLFFEIDDKESIASVRRSFSALTIADLLCGDRENEKTFDEAFISVLSQRLRDYLLKERDFRGHVKELGWVHTIAHAGDAFSALIEHPNMSQSDLLEILKTIITFIKSRDHNVFQWEENFRLGWPISVLIDRLGVEKFVEAFHKEVPVNYMYEKPYAQNMINTLRCSFIEIYNREPEDTKKLSLTKQMFSPN